MTSGGVTSNLLDRAAGLGQVTATGVAVNIDNTDGANSDGYAGGCETSQ